MKYGADGYAIYWYCLEIIAGDLEGENANFELSHDAEVIGYNLKVDRLRVEEIVRYMVDLNLFEQSGANITCLKMAKFLDKKVTRNIQIHKIIDSFNNIENVADKSGQSETVADNPKHSALDEIRLDKNKNKYIPPIGDVLLSDFLKVRKAKRAGELTETAFKAIEREAKKAGVTVERAIEICCLRGWVGFNAEWIESTKEKTNEVPDWKRGLL